MISFFVEGNPVPQARPRTFWHAALRKFVTMNPRRSEDWKGVVRNRSIPYRPREPIDYPVRVKMEFHLPRPKSAKNKTWADVRPDLDNYSKGILDALQAAGYLKDDARVVWLECKKIYAEEDQSGVLITIQGVDEQ
jgi:Holliday junction resolvase RusA-like endonuclease